MDIITSKIKVAVDLTPLRPGGENGGAKILVLTLLNAFASLRTQEFHYLLITENWNHEELLQFQGSNMTCILHSEIYRPRSQEEITALNASISGIESLGKSSSARKYLNHKKIGQIIDSATTFLLRLGKRLFRRHKHWLSRVMESIKHRRLYKIMKSRIISVPPEEQKAIPKNSTQILQNYFDIDLLFCPFSSPQLAEEGLPLVAIAYDLQHLEMPFFFTPEECVHRTRFLNNLVFCANKIICISEFTRQSLLNHFSASEDRLTAIPICIHERLMPLGREDITSAVKRLGLDEGRYLFFPANFWLHKNHRMLLSAYSIYRHNNPGIALDLVFTGALEDPQVELREMVRHMGYEANVHFLGFLGENDLIALWQGCRGLIFPSLHEGFGIPILEAMWFDKPVACSNIGSLPEVGDNAVVYFDPRKPEEIAAAMAQIAHDDALTDALRERAQQHIKAFNQQAMAEQYLAVFSNELVTAKSSIPSLF